MPIENPPASPSPDENESSPSLGSLASEATSEARLADRVAPTPPAPTAEEISPDKRPRDETRRISRSSLSLVSEAEAAPESTAAGESPAESPPEFLCVVDLMNREPKTVRADKTMASYADLRAWTGVGHALVLDRNGALVGLLTEHDFLAVSPSTRVPKLSKADRRQFLDGLPIEKVMRSKIQIIGPRATVQQAAAMMAEHKVGCLPVMDQSRLLGSIDRDVVLAALARIQPARKPAAEQKGTKSDSSRPPRPTGRFSRWAPWLR